MEDDPGLSFQIVELDNTAAWAAHGFEGSPPDLVTDVTLVDAWRRRWASNPDATMLLDESGTSLSGSDLEERTRVAAGRLRAAGLAPRARVLMSCGPCLELVIAHAAALRAGLTVVPVNTAFSAAELENVANAASAELLILDDPSRAPTGWPMTGPDLAALPPIDANSLADQGEEIHLRAEDPALLLYTSGTTGTPKGALLSHSNILASARALVVAWKWTPEDRLVLSLPLFHMHGLGVGVHGSLLAGASAVIVAKFSPTAVLDAARDHHATMLFGVPTMWIRLLESARVDELRSLRLCVSGSAPLASEVWLGLEERAGQKIVERYGMTETVMLTSNPYRGERRPGSVGLALPGVSVALANAGPDEVGEIVVRGPNVFLGYLDRPDSNAEAFTPDGWFRTGDLGRADADGYLSIVGRSKDLIITGGFNVYPRDVEEVISTHSDVAEVAIVGQPSREWGETVTACVVARPGTVLNIAELDELAIDHLAGYQRPRRWVIVDQLPRNALGKVVKAELAQLFESNER